MMPPLCHCCKHCHHLKDICTAYPDGIPAKVCDVPPCHYENNNLPYPSNCNGSGIGFEPKEWYVKYKERVAYCEAHGIPMVDD